MSKTNFNGFSSSVSLWTFIFIRTVVSWTLVQGQTVIGPSRPIVVTEGDDVILPCHVEPQLNVEEVRWWRPDLQPDPGDPQSQDGYVHRYPDNQDVEDKRISSYVGRTALFKDELKNGNASLRIKRVRLSDGGRYRCLIPQVETRHRATTIRLVVVKTSTTETSQRPRNPQTPDPKDTMEDGRSHPITWILPVVVLLCVAAGVGTYCITQRCQKQDDVESNVTLKKMLPA